MLLTLTSTEEEASTAGSFLFSYIQGITPISVFCDTQYPFSPLKSNHSVDGMRNHKGDINDSMLALYSIERVTHLIYEERYSFMCLSAKKNEQ